MPCGFLRTQSFQCLLCRTSRRKAKAGGRHCARRTLGRPDLMPVPCCGIRSAMTPHTRRIVAAGAIGNVLEWYDFAIYGYFAASIGRTFFPQTDHVAQVLAAF